MADCDSEFCSKLNENIIKTGTGKALEKITDLRYDCGSDEIKMR